MTLKQLFKIPYFTLMIMLVLLTIGHTKQVLSDDDLIADLGEVNIGDPVSWSSDSKNFVVIDQSSNIDAVDLSSPGWWQYNLQTQTLNSYSRWPLQPTLTEQELNLFRPEGFIYASPNGRFIFYSKRSTDNSYHVAVGDRQRLREVITPIHDGPFGAPSQFFPVVWSENSLVLSFADFLSAEAPDLDVFALSLDVTDADFHVTVKWFGKVVIDNKTWFTLSDQMYDISADGSAILLTANNEDGGTSLIIWTPDNLNTNKVITGLKPRSFDAISFAPGNIDQLLSVTEQGDLQVFNIATEQITTLRAGLIGERAFGVWFSPNGKWLANYFDYGKLRFIDVQTLLPQAAPTKANTLATPTHINSPTSGDS